MKVVEVIPIVKGIQKQTLSYFTKEKFLPGSFVRIPLRKGSSLGIVTSSKDARKSKSDIKGANFALRKLSVVEKAGALSEGFMKAIRETANFYATTDGAVLKTLLPKIILESPEILNKKVGKPRAPHREIKIIGLGDEERFREYRSIVRECFARGKSIMFVVPTREELLKAESLLSLGIEKYVFTTSETAPKKLRQIILKARDEKHPILFITLPSLVAFDRNDLDAIILERENSRAYRTLTRPYIHMKVFLECYAKAKGITLILGDSVLSLESLYKEKSGVYAEFTPITWRLKHSSATEVIDMKAKKDFEIISQGLEHSIRKALDEKKKVFIFAVRKGLSTTTICGDCASLLLCRNCGAPLVLHSSKDKNTPPIYACHHCGARRSSETKCDNCSSWKLVPLGIGVDRVVEECERLFPHTDIYVIDKDHTPTKARVKAVGDRFHKGMGGILIGTELVLGTLSHVPLVAVASLDSLFSIPDFAINERIFYLITRLREISTEKFVIQTRNAGKEILEYASVGNILDFYRTEVEEREELSYPPFSLFIKVSTQGNGGEIERKAALLQNIFKDRNPHFIKERGRASNPDTLSMIIRLARSEWPNEELQEKLLLLTPDFMVKVDPETIL